MRSTLLISTAVFALLIGLPAAYAQGSCTFTDENGKTVTLANCAAPDDKATDPAATKKPAPPLQTGNRFPFPGEEAAATPTPPAATNGTPQSAAPKKFPFPGEEPAAPTTGTSPLQDAGSSGTPPPDSDSSSSSSSSSSGAPAGTGPLAGDDDEAAAKAAAKAAARRRSRLPKGPRQTPDEQEEEDLRVAAFYQSDGNFAAAYSRATDAVKLVDDDLDAHLALAEAARRLGKFDEAQQHYKRTLALDPPARQRKIAEQALKQMAGGH